MLGLHVNNFSMKKSSFMGADNSQSVYSKKAGAYNSMKRTVKPKKQDAASRVINTVFDNEAPRINELNYKITFESDLHSNTPAFEIEKIESRPVCKVQEPLAECFIKTENRIKDQPIDFKDPAFILIQKHKKSRKILKLDNQYFNADSLEIEEISTDETFNYSFNEPLRKRIVRENEYFTPVKFMKSTIAHNKAKKLKKPKILKSDGQTVTAESVLRMVDPSFLVSSDVDDSSMISMNNPMAFSNPLKLNNLLDDLKTFDQIDSALSNSETYVKSRAHSSLIPSSLSKGFT